MSDPTPGPDNWSVTKKLGGLSALLAAIALILTQVQGISSSLFGLYHKMFPPSAPYDVTATYPTDVPSYLRYYYLDEGFGKQESLHWFRAVMHNETRQPITLVVSFDLAPIDCEFVQLREGWKPDEYELKGGETLQKEVDPGLVWVNKDSSSDCYLEIHYSVKDDRGDKPHPVSTDKVRILPRHKVKWNLVNVDRKSVSKGFLIASLSAWSLSREGNVLKLAGQLRKQQGASSPEQWIKLCYEHLFQGQATLTINPTASTYPFEQETTLRTPGQVLSDGDAEPLEAAFLMAAIVRAAAPGQTALTLFILPQGKKVKNPAVLLAWTAPNSDTREAVDLTLAGKLSFQENLQQSQALLKEALTKDPEILGTVSDRGVFFGMEANSPTVIAFDRAVEEFKILPLP